MTKEAADVNGDGDVNSTDVVCIYNFIISGDISGQSAGSKPFYPEADGDDTEMTILVGSTDNKAEIPVTVYLTNPTVTSTSSSMTRRKRTTRPPTPTAGARSIPLSMLPVPQLTAPTYSSSPSPTPTTRPSRRPRVPLLPFTSTAASWQTVTMW